MDDNKFLLLLEKVSEIGERTARMEADQTNIKEDLAEVKNQYSQQNEKLDKYNDLLDDHIQGVITANQRLDNEIKFRQNLEKRVEHLEVPRKFLGTLKTILLYLAAVAGAIITVIELFNR